MFQINSHQILLPRLPENFVLLFINFHILKKICRNSVI